MDESMALFCAHTDHAADDLAAFVHAAQADPVAFGALSDRYVERVYAYLRADVRRGRGARPHPTGVLTGAGRAPALSRRGRRVRGLALSARAQPGDQCLLP